MTRGFDVLLIDDDSASLDALGELLETYGFTVRVADSADEALSIVRKQQPRLILSDVVMPRMSGTDLARRLKQEPGLDAVPFILMSGKEPPRTDEPVQGWMRKPLQIPELLKVIQPMMRP